MASTLHHAYQTLMTKAPGAAFRRARSLYLNKYAFPDPNPDSAFRLFVSREALEEGLRPADDGNPEHSIVTLTATALELAVVHWQQPEAPTTAALLDYLRDTWSMQPDPSSWHQPSESWFRNGGHQTRLAAPEGLLIKQQSLLTLRE